MKYVYIIVYIIENYVCFYIILLHRYCICINGIFNEKDCID